MFDILMVARAASLIPAIDLVSKKLGPAPGQQFICRERFDCLLGDCATDDGAKLIRETSRCQANHAGACSSAPREKSPDDCLWAHG